MQFKPDLFKGHLHITAGERGGVCGQDPSFPAADGGRLRTPPCLESAGPCLHHVALAHKILFPSPPGN